MQETLKIRRRTAVCAAAVLTALVLLSAVFVTVSEAGHDCSGDGCPVCAAINVCRDTLRVFAALAVCSVRTAVRLPVTAPVIIGAAVFPVRAISGAVGIRLLN